MKINSINNSVNFGRVIKVTTNTNGKFGLADINKPISDVLDVLNSRPTDAYTNAQQDRIRCFFQKSINDYNGKNGITIKTDDIDLFIISGKDFKKLDKQLKNEKKLGCISRIFSKKQNKKIKKDVVYETLKNAELGFPLTDTYSELYMDSSAVKPNMGIKEIRELDPEIDSFKYLSIKQNPYMVMQGKLEL